MKLFFKVGTLLLYICFITCNQSTQKSDYILTERNLIPEGTAFDNRTGVIYVSSTFKRKIVQIAADGKINDFIPEKMNNIASVLGMEVDEEHDVLWACVDHANQVLPLKDPDPVEDWKSSICSFDIQTGKLLKQYHLHADTSFLNDLTVLPSGEVFATETVHHKVYRISPLSDSLELFLDPQGFDFLNGITYSDKWNCLFVTSEQGIINIDLTTKKYHRLKTPSGMDVGNIDGLTLYKDRLIAHLSTKVVAFHLNENGSEIIRSQTLDTGKEFDSSTTGEIGGNDYYFIVNSQVRSGIDHLTKTIKPADSLKDVIIRRISL